MKNILKFGLVAALAAFAFTANAQQVLLEFQPGPRLIDGSQLNKLVDRLNGEVFGEIALDGANPTAVSTGLTSINGCILTIKSATSTGVDTSVLTYNTSSGTLSIYAWKPTSSSDTTLIASTGTQTVGYLCNGTR